MRKLRITIGNSSYDVTVEDLTEEGTYPNVPTPVPTSTAPVAAKQPAPGVKPPASGAPAEAGAVTSPMAGVIKSVLVKAGDNVNKGQSLVVLEAMKMENQVTAPAAGTVKEVKVEVESSVQEGQVLVVLE